MPITTGLSIVSNLPLQLSVNILVFPLLLAKHKCRKDASVELEAACCERFAIPKIIAQFTK